MDEKRILDTRRHPLLADTGIMEFKSCFQHPEMRKKFSACEDLLTRLYYRLLAQREKSGPG